MPLALPKTREEIKQIQSERKKIALQRARLSKFHEHRLKNINENKKKTKKIWADEIGRRKNRYYQRIFFYGWPYG